MKPSRDEILDAIYFIEERLESETDPKKLRQLAEELSAARTLLEELDKRS